MNLHKSPCYQCTRDTKCESCHDTCQEFLEWKAEKTKINNKEREDRRQYRSNNIVALVCNRVKKRR